jgi:hypothetical protein
MQKLLGFRACGLCLAGVAILSAMGFGQAGQEADSTAPKDLLLKAAHANGLRGADLKPWHIKITFEVTDRRPSRGTFEEFWAGPQKFKRIFATSTFNQVEYTTDTGICRTGSPDGAPTELTEIIDEILDPVSLDQAALDATSFKVETPSIGDSRFLCITALQASSPTYCTNEHSPVLRLQFSEGGATRFVRNSIISFQDRFLPQMIQQFRGTSSSQKPVASARLELVEALSSLEESFFTPPTEAVPPPQVITLGERTTKRQLLHHPFPQYDSLLPGEHRAVHMASMVEIAFRIQTDGHVANLRVLGGPPRLIQASLDAVAKWTYKPFTEHGEPVEVETTALLVNSLTP